VPAVAGGRYDPVLDQWQPMSLDGAPRSRLDGTVVWTGELVLVWGGSSWGVPWPGVSAPGAAYDPELDLWRPISTVDEPEERFGHSAVWTGSEMLIWGGGARGDMRSSGGTYSPAEDRWRPLPSSGAPEPRRYHAAVWTGTEMIVFGGETYTEDHAWEVLGDGARLDLASGIWTSLPAVDRPAPRYVPSAVWTGTEMIIWAGRSDPTSWRGNEVVTGASFDPAQDAWTPMSTRNVPAERSDPVVVWDGTQMVVIGGRGTSLAPFATAGALAFYRPASSTGQDRPANDPDRTPTSDPYMEVR
jgi:hypothetical protein